MRKGLLGSLAAILASTSLASAQVVPYGYAPAQPYGTPNGYYGYNYAPSYPINYGMQQGYYPPGYAAMYGMQQGYTPSYPMTYGAPQSYPVPSAPPPSPKPTVAPAPPGRIPSGPTAPGNKSNVPANLPPEPIPTLPLSSSPGDSHESHGHDAQEGELPPDAAAHSSGWGAAIGQGDAGGPRVWGSADFLLWRFKNAPLPVPLVTQGLITPETLASGIAAGAIGQPGTLVLSPSDFKFGWVPGGRVTLGGYVDADRRFGLEGSGFLMDLRTSRFTVGSGPSDGNEVLSVPFFGLSPLGNMENVLQLTDPMGSPNATQATVSIVNRIRFWGSDVNAVVRLLDNDVFTLGALAGFRYLDLTEDLTLQADIINSPAAVSVPPSSILNFTDTFATRNQFYGAQVGVNGEVRLGVFFLNVAGKIAAGTMHETVIASGATTTNFNGVLGTYSVPSTTIPTGIFTQATNIGRFSQDHFAYVPEVKADLGVELWRRVRLFAGYDFLYASNVVRPGDQIDRQINIPNLPPGFPFPPAPATTITTPFHPAVPLYTTSFWAHGVNIGVEFSY